MENVVIFESRGNSQKLNLEPAIFSHEMLVARSCGLISALYIFYDILKLRFLQKFMFF